MDSSAYDARDKTWDEPAAARHSGLTAISQDKKDPSTNGQLRDRRPTGDATRLERWLARRLLESIDCPDMAIALWNGDVITANPASETLRTASNRTIHIHDRRTFWQLVSDPTYQFAEGYANRKITVSGDLTALLVVILRHGFQSNGHAGLSKRGKLWTWWHRPRKTTLSASSENIHHHYDIGNDFYRLWLDEQLLYTCAYFAEPAMTLEQAQIAKMDHVCKKLWLKPGDTVIEAGCGWGALALHMAKHYGVQVRAYNISREQIAYARQRADDEGLGDRVEFVLDDWRHIRGSCDAFVSVGMLEHVGVENYRELGRVIDRCLEPHGRGLIHTIGRNQPRPLDRWIERRIFPGAYPPTLRQMTDLFEPSGFSILDVENLRLHYADTLKHWLARFEKSAETVRKMFDDRFVRMWRMYLAGSMATFATGGLQLFQVVFNRGDCHRIPRNRRHLYESPDSEPIPPLWHLPGENESFRQLQ